MGFTNFSFGMPKDIREDVESAYLTLAVDAGLDFVLGNPEKQSATCSMRTINTCARRGCPRSAADRPDGETQEDAGFRQAEKIMELFR